MIHLRPFQAEVEAGVYAEWRAGARTVIAVMPTGAGKTVLFSKIMADQSRPSVAIAHRQELVGQISLALARNGVRHRIIGPRAVASACAGLHLAETGRNFIDPSSPRAVAGVDTLVRRQPEPWMQQIGLWVIDEAHHVLADNKWGTAAKMFPNAHGLGVTATPCRADGRGLGRHADGLMDAMVVGPTMRVLIDDGWLSDYRVFAPPSDLHLESVGISAGGDFSPVPLRKAVHESRITGDVVEHYRRIAPGRLGVTFAVDVAAATEIAAAFRAAGVPSEVVSAETPDALRAHVLRRFRNREVLQLVNVDLFGEGFDLPALEVVSMARPTQSYALYAQQFGRALRVLDGKERAIIIDHVGNVLRHGLPDAPRVWTLDRRERRSRAASDLPPLRVCLTCTGAYDRILAACPYCGEAWVPAERSTPAQVDGDLAELSPEALQRLRGEVDRPLVVPYGAPPEVIGAVRKRHREAQEAQQALRAAMAEWAGRHSTATDAATVSALQRRFYLEHGIDVLSAQALGRREADELRERLWYDRSRNTAGNSQTGRREGLGDLAEQQGRRETGKRFIPSLGAVQRLRGTWRPDTLRRPDRDPPSADRPGARWANHWAIRQYRVQGVDLAARKYGTRGSTAPLAGLDTRARRARGHNEQIGGDMNEIVFGDCRTSMIDMIGRGDRVQMCVTSPPYFGLRDYGHPGQLGLEQTPDEYVAAMVEVFSLVWYLLADDGVLWLNLGDSYARTGGTDRKVSSTAQVGSTRNTMEQMSDRTSKASALGIKDKDLIGIPWRVAFALQAAGWYLRQDIIWHKPNPMPESVTDRCTKAHEYLFLLSKSDRYYFDNEAIKEPANPDNYRANASRRAVAPGQTPQGKLDSERGGVMCETRNRRSVWTVATKPYKGAHFATFPPALIEPCILAGTSQEGHCPKCGKRWERVVKRTAENHTVRQDRQVATGGAITGGVGKNFPDVTTETLGFFPSCECGADPVPDVVFDPFMGSGTTAQVALQHGRRYLGCELNPDYEQLQKQRILA